MPSISTVWAVPISLLIEAIVRSGLVIAWRFATCPTILSPVLENATTDGVVLAPSALAITTASPPSITATQEFVVPKSMPIIFPIINSSLQYSAFGRLPLIYCI